MQPLLREKLSLCFLACAYKHCWVKENFCNAYMCIIRKAALLCSQSNRLYHQCHNVILTDNMKSEPKQTINRCNHAKHIIKLKEVTFCWSLVECEMSSGQISMSISDIYSNEGIFFPTPAVYITSLSCYYFCY